jgi:hypothetical protein
MPLVSVLMPVHNAERYIAAAIDSILQQTFTDFELIIVDDGSTDSTPEVIARCRDPRIKSLRQRNTGISGALNAGLRAASSSAELLARMDADDIAFSERLERQVAFMRELPEHVVLGTWVWMLCPAGLPIYEKQNPADHEEIARRLWSGDSQAIIHPAAMMRKEAVLRIGGYRERYSAVEDLDLYLRLLAHGRFANIAAPLLGYRQHPASTNARKYHLQVRLMQELVAELDPQCPYRDLDRSLLNGWRIEPPWRNCRRWGWNALKRGEVALARQYAAAALRQAPLSIENWRLLYCAARGR